MKPAKTPHLTGPEIGLAGLLALATYSLLSWATGTDVGLSVGVGFFFLCGTAFVISIIVLALELLGRGS